MITEEIKGEAVIVSVYGVQCPSCKHVNDMPYECLPKHDRWEAIDCDNCETKIDYRGWQNGQEIDYHSRLNVHSIVAGLTTAQKNKLHELSNSQPIEYPMGKAGANLVKQGLAFINELGARHLTDLGHNVYRAIKG